MSLVSLAISCWTCSVSWMLISDRWCCEALTWFCVVYEDDCISSSRVSVRLPDSVPPSAAGVCRLELDGSSSYSAAGPVCSMAFDRWTLCSVTEISGLLSSS